MSGFMETWSERAREIETKKRRHACLSYLSKVGNYEASSILLHSHCQRMGVPTTRDQIASALAWLSDEGLVDVRSDQTPVARLTILGLEVADGHVVHPGVMRPDP